MRRCRGGGRNVIEMRRAQLSFGDGLIAGEVSDLREGWMTHADRVLADEQIVGAVYEALARRHPKSRSRGRLGAPAEVVLRLLILKHVRNWSYHVLEREVRAISDGVRTVRDLGNAPSNVITFSVRKPGASCMTLRKACSTRPDAVSSTRASAISPTTKVLSVEVREESGPTVL